MIDQRRTFIAQRYAFTLFQILWFAGVLLFVIAALYLLSWNAYRLEQRSLYQSRTNQLSQLERQISYTNQIILRHSSTTSPTLLPF